jgi:16S rRNA (cytosine967-C5)-methyltransferase
LRSYGLEAASHPFLESAIKIQGVKVNLHTLKEFNQGLFEIQDLSSQCIGLACAPKPGEMWWDACAGGGGKSLQLADLMNRKGSVRATDTRAYKLEDLKKRAARAAFPNIRTAPWDGTAPDPKRRATFDGVLVDSPCSSSGRWRRNPDARWIASKAWVDELSEIQMKILSAASAAVKPGGVLVYATCSMFQREDADNAARFLSKHPEFSLESFPNPLNGEMTDGSLLTLPWDGDCDASFVARFRKGS